MVNIPEDKETNNNSLIIILIVIMCIIITFSIFFVNRFAIFGPLEHEEKYYIYTARIEYNTTLSAEDLLVALEPLHYILSTSYPYIEINCSLSLSDFNETASEIYGNELSNGTIYSDDSEFLIWIHSYHDNRQINIEFDTDDMDATPFTNKYHSKIIIEKYASYIEELIFQYTSERGHIEILSDYIGPES